MKKQGNSKITNNNIYKDNFAHLADELKKLDLLILRQVKIFRQQNEKLREITLDPRVYVSKEEVDYLLNAEQEHQTKVDTRKTGADEAGKNSSCQHEIALVSEKINKLQNEIGVRVVTSLKAGVYLALPQLAHLFNLSTFELQVVVICLAPELRRKYDKIFVYLQDDIARKKPGIDMILDLLCQTEAEKWQVRSVFSDNAPLFRSGILQIAEDTRNPSGSSDLGRFLKLDPRILDFLSGSSDVDSRLMDAAKLYQPALSLASLLIDPAIKNRLMSIIQGHLAVTQAGSKKLLLHFYGPPGAGKRELASGICRELDCPLLYIDMEMLFAKESEAGKLLRLAFREALLHQAVLYIDNIDPLLSEDTRAKALLKSLSHLTAEYGWLSITAGEKSWTPGKLSSAVVFHSTHLKVPAVQIRQKAWERALAEEGVIDRKNTWAAELARQFRLTPGQIHRAVEYAYYHYALGNKNSKSKDQEKITLHNLYNASCSQSNQKLTELAVKIDPKYRWQDIVLEEKKIDQLKEICSQVKYRHRVFSEWGFEEKLSYGKGLSVLFAGSPGTGKTMAAEVMAHELQLDLYKIDLSGVVSKYIGETEKNLARIFNEAETSNALLFFDEADALFGKRTEVMDAHDRYANIETSFLLQKMEEYEGIVILATNMRQNMDDAFVRRIRFIVDFPFPDEASRLRIWKSHFPIKAPLSKEIDYEFLAGKVQVSGGSIRNIVLNAAFSAARDGGTIEMKHILTGTKREYEKIGKLFSEQLVLHLK